MLCSSAARVTFLTVKHFLPIPCCGYRVGVIRKQNNEGLLENCIKFYILNWSRNIWLWNSLLSERLEGRYEAEETKQRKRRVKANKVSVINEFGTEGYMSLAEALRYAKRNNLSLVKLESNSKEKEKYKLQGVRDILQTQGKKKDENKTKQVLIRMGISKNDLATKINQMLKFLKKKVNVTCVIESKDQTRAQEICNVINASELQHYCANQVKLNKGLRFEFQAKQDTAEEKPENATENVSGQSGESGQSGQSVE